MDAEERASQESETRSLIGGGESQGLEYKASLRFDYTTKTVNRELTRVVAKTVAAFMNSSGGTLLIGVSDDGAVLGLQNDLSTLSAPTLDLYERALRTAISNLLGVDISPTLDLAFVAIDGETIVRVGCPRHRAPVFLRNGDQPEFYIRDGNQSKPLDVRATHDYIVDHWGGDEPVTVDSLREVMSELLREQFSAIQTEDMAKLLRGSLGDETSSGTPIPIIGDSAPLWIRVGTRRVLDLFLQPLSRSTGWKRIFIISPWISDIAHSSSITSDQFLQRLQRDKTTAYIVTRPPQEEWHERAILRLGESGRANIALVPDLHIKLYTALTDQGSFAMLGSANFTQQALANKEIGLLVNSYSDGRKLVSELNYEAAQIYRLPDRQLIYRASFS